MSDAVELRALFSDLVRLETELWDAVEARLRAEHDLTLGRFEVLDLVATHDGTARVQDVAAALSITVGGVSKLVDRLEAAGLLVRAPNPDDRRSSLLELTRAGAGLRDIAGATVRAELDVRLGAVLSPRRLRDLHRSIVDLREAP